MLVEEFIAIVIVRELEILVYRSAGATPVFNCLPPAPLSPLAKRSYATECAAFDDFFFRPFASGSLKLIYDGLA